MRGIQLRGNLHTDVLRQIPPPVPRGLRDLGHGEGRGLVPRPVGRDVVFDLCEPALHGVRGQDVVHAGIQRLARAQAAQGPPEFGRGALLQPLLQQCIAVARGQHLVVFTQLHQPAVGIAATASL